MKSTRFICCIFLFLGVSLQKFITHGQILNSDSEQYSDEVYRQLASEYDYELKRTSTRKPKHLISDSDSSDPDILEDDDESNTEEREEVKESYRDAITRLKCDNPWFWNSFKCLWLDIGKRNYVPRTTSNAITVTWILGPPLVLFIIFLCSFFVVACYMRAKVKQMEERINEMRKTYEPGSIRLDDGKVKKYEPTEEEIEAFENLFSTLVSIV